MTKVSYLGPEGTFSEIAVDQYFNHKNYNKIPCSSIADAISSVLKDVVDFAVVPLENKTIGKIADTSHALKEAGSNLAVVDTIKIPIELAVGGFGNEGGIAKLLSKDSALEQCIGYIRKKFNIASLDEAYKAEFIKKTTSTAEAMRIICSSKDPTLAVIGSSSGFNKYKIPIYQRDIGDTKQNYTVFGILKRS